MLKKIMLTVLLLTVSGAFAEEMKPTCPVPPKIGGAAPDFSLKGSDGKTYKLSDFKDKQIVVLEWFNKDCPYVRKHYDAKNMQKLQNDLKTKPGVAWLTIASSAPGKEGHLTEANASQVRTENGMNNTALLLDVNSEVARKYCAKTTPHMFVIDKKGLIAYQGAIDDKPSANPKSLDDAQNYVLAAVMAVDRKLPVANASTTPYGCSVKY